MSKYSSGAKFENEVKRALEKRGYFVIRSAGSKSPVDLVAFKEDNSDSLKNNMSSVLFIQCKYGNRNYIKSFLKKEENEFVKFCNGKVGFPIIAYRYKRSDDLVVYMCGIGLRLFRSD